VAAKKTIDRELTKQLRRHCEQSEAIQGDTRGLDCFAALRAPRNDDSGEPAFRSGADLCASVL
jgi:hypothetical protein